MPTIQQLLRKGRTGNKKKSKASAFKYGFNTLRTKSLITNLLLKEEFVSRFLQQHLRSLTLD